MKYIKLFEYYQDIDYTCRRYNIKNYTVNNQGLVDVDGSVDLYDKELDKLPLKFGEVSFEFICVNNGLTSLNGAPNIIGGNFKAQFNQINTLKYFPKYVGGNIDISYNELTSLYGICSKVSKVLDISDNKLTTLEHCPELIPGTFRCGSNNLETLKFGPKEVDGSYICSRNNLKSLKYMPKIKDGYYAYIDKNPLPEILLDLNNSKKLNAIINLQDEYNIWNYNDTLNISRLELLLESIS